VTKILVIEDEAIVALDIKSALEHLGFEVTDTASTYDEALESVKNCKPDILLTDINLAGSKDGIETVQDIQKIKNIPIIYLTAYSDDKTIKRAIQTNPIGYLLKPFKREELKSTIFLSLHKINQSNNIKIDKESINLGFNYYFDLENEILLYQNMPIVLSKKERMLMTILVEARGSIVPFRYIESLIWSDNFISDSTLRTLLYRLRAKLEYKLIETIPTIGCKLTPVF
jgi:DNA-binding response OmpR family regulator